MIPNFATTENLLLTTSLLRPDSYSSVQLSPQGNYIVGLKHEARQTLLIARESRSSKETIILTLDMEQDDKLTQFKWVNNDTLFVNFFNPYQHLRLVEIYKTASGIQNRGFDIKANGFLIDPVVEDKDRLIFSHYQHEDEEHKAIDTDIGKLKSGKLKSAKALNKGLDNSRSFVTDAQHNLRLVTVLDDDKFKIMFYSSANKNWKPILNKLGRRDYFKPIAIIDDDIYALSNYGRDKIGVLKFNQGLIDNVEVLYESPKYDLTKAVVDELTGKLISVSYLEYGQTAAKYFDTQIPQSLLSRKEFEDKRVIRINRSADKNHSLYSVSSPTFPGAYYYHNESDDSLIHLYDVLPELMNFNFQPSFTELIPISEKESLEAYLTLPNSQESAYPMLVVPHGGPIGIRDTNSFDRKSQILANRGYAVLRVNFRGSKGFGKKFQHSGIAQFGKQIEEDIERAVTHVIAKYPIDSSKMCIMGSSYGGYSALMSTIKYPERYQCAVTSIGVSDLPLLFSSSNLFQIPKVRAGLINIAGDVYQDIDQAHQHSPVYRADELNTPILILAGAKDKTAYPEHSIRLNYVLKKLDKKPEFEMYRNSGHGHSTVEGNRHELLRTLEFLDKYLQKNRIYSESDKDTLAQEMVFLSTQYRPSGVADKSTERMVELALVASELGSIEGKYLVATYYANGIVLSKDLGKAIQYYQQASNLDHLQSTMLLANSYKYGRLGLEKNNQLALKYYKRAFKKNSFEGGYQMALILICNDKKQAALEALESLSDTSGDYSEFAMNEIRKTTKESLICN
jgi:dipeptidyl aminopeptidase/acylaminoacyl peptidase